MLKRLDLRFRMRSSDRTESRARQRFALEPLEDRRLLAVDLLPLSFEPNVGQAADSASFLSRGDGYTLLLSATEAIVELANADGIDYSEPNVGDRVKMQIMGGNGNAEASGTERLPGHSNYLLGNDPAEWHTGVPHYGRVVFDDVYPGIDLVYYGTSQSQLEYDFLVEGGSDPDVISLQFDGIESLKLDDKGSLILQTRNGQVRQQAPVIYQDTDDGRQPVSGGYVLLDSNRVGFKMSPYDATLPLVIDPILTYSSYLGDTDREFSQDIAVDAEENIYVTGAWQRRHIEPDGRSVVDYDSFVTKLTPAGDAVIYRTFIGGRATGGTSPYPSQGNSLVADAAGNVYLVGDTMSPNFPVTPNGFDQIFNVTGGTSSRSDGFFLKLDPTGMQLLYSTYIGGAGPDKAADIALGSDGNAYLVGTTGSADFLTTAGAFQEMHQGLFDDAFVMKIDPSASEETSLLYSTYLGANSWDYGHGIALDTADNVYAVGSTQSTDFPTTLGAFQTTHNGFSDAFVVKLMLSGGGASDLVYSTLLGGANDGNSEMASDIVVDAQGNAYLTGVTGSRDDRLTAEYEGFPVTAGAYQSALRGSRDLFVSKLSPAGDALVYSTYLGGSGDDGRPGLPAVSHLGLSSSRLAIDAFGNAYVTATTRSLDFPTTPDALPKPTFSANDGILAKLSRDGDQLLYSTYFGGTRDDASRGIALAEVQAIEESLLAEISGNGRFTVFRSDAPNLVGGDTNGVSDIFVYDRVLATTRRVSVDSRATEADGASDSPAISADGRFVTFASTASNLLGLTIPGDTNGASDIFVHDLQAGITTRVSLDSAGNEANGGSFNPDISADGRYVVFESRASNLVGNDTNGVMDIFVRDRQTGTTRRASIGNRPNFEQGNDDSFDAAISADGQLVTFASEASNLLDFPFPGADTNGSTDIFVRDLVADMTTRVNVNSAGGEANRGSFRPAISGDGRFVAFESFATNLAGTTNSGSSLGIPLIQDFAGPGFTGWIPPDPSVAVGPEQIVAVVNSRIAIHDKATGIPVFARNLSGTGGFFGNVGATANVIDPHIVFDSDSQRFFATAFEVTQANESFIYLAVSTDATPTGVADWHRYQIGAGSHFPDYAKVGVDQDAVWISANYFPITGSGATGNYVGITAIDKAPLLSGGAANILYEEHIAGDNTLLVFPLNHYGSSPASYFVEARLWSGGSGMAVHAVTDLRGSPTRTRTVIDVPEFHLPARVPQLGGGEPADAVAAWTSTGVWRDGSIWTAHAIVDPAIGDGETLVRWYEIRFDNNGAAYIHQYGDVDPGPQRYAWMPAISVDFAGNMGLGFSLGGPNEHFGIGFTGRRESAPLGTTEPINVLHAGENEYVRLAGTTNRWGDYSGIAIDPADSVTFWAFHEYAAATPNTWLTRIGSFRLRDRSDVYVHDRQTGITRPVGVNSAANFSASISDDGRYIAFASRGSDLESIDVFVRDMQTATAYRASQSDAGHQGNDWSQNPAISADGRFVAFDSLATNLVLGDRNDKRDVFIHHLVNSGTDRVSVPSRKGQVYVVGGTASADDPGTPENEGLPLVSPLQPAFGGDRDAFIATFNFDADLDGDGVSDFIEQGIGDGNGDGIPDNLQANVASLPNAVDDTYVTLVAPADTALVDLVVLENPSPADAPEVVEFPVGFFQFTVDGLSPGGSAVVQMIAHGENVAPDTFYKFGPTPGQPTPHWYEFAFDGTTGAEFRDLDGDGDTDQIDLHFIDGQRGDNDLTANGAVSDPGGPAHMKSADLQITTIESPDVVQAGNTVTYTVTVRNNGPTEAPAVTLVDTLPTGVSFVSSTPAELVCDEEASTVICHLGTLAVGESTDVTITAAVSPLLPVGANLTNIGSVSSLYPDPDHPNNRIAEDVEVDRSADVSISQAILPQSISPGSQVTYTISVTNDGPSDASGIMVNDILPDNVIFVSAKVADEFSTPKVAPCTAAFRTVTCNLGNLSSGESADITVVVDVPISTAEGTVLTNDVTVAATESDPDGSNNRSTEVSTVTTAEPSGDFNRDGIYDCGDIDSLVAAIAAKENDSALDLNRDGSVDRQDVDDWLTEAARANGLNEPYRPGDATLDGRVNATDLNVVGLNWQMEVNGWCQGDFSADGRVAASDLNALGLNWRSEIVAAARLAAPPKSAPRWRVPRAPLAVGWPAHLPSAPAVDVARHPSTHRAHEAAGDISSGWQRTVEQWQKFSMQVAETRNSRLRFRYAQPTRTDLGVLPTLDAALAELTLDGVRSRCDRRAIPSFSET